MCPKPLQNNVSIREKKPNVIYKKRAVLPTEVFEKQSKFSLHVIIIVFNSVH